MIQIQAVDGTWIISVMSEEDLKASFFHYLFSDNGYRYYYNTVIDGYYRVKIEKTKPTTHEILLIQGC